MDLISKKVKAIHFGTHSVKLHSDLHKMFLKHGWKVIQSYQGERQDDKASSYGTMPGRFENTAFGRIRLGDGVLEVVNPLL